MTNKQCPTAIGDRIKQLQSFYPDFAITIRWYDSPIDIGAHYLRMQWTATNPHTPHFTQGSASSLNDNPGPEMISSVLDYLTRNAWDTLMTHLSNNHSQHIRPEAKEVSIPPYPLVFASHFPSCYTLLTYGRYPRYPPTNPLSI